MKQVVSKVLILGLLAGLLGAGYWLGNAADASDLPPPPAPPGTPAPPAPPGARVPITGAGSVEELLKKTDLTYKKLSDNVYKVMVEGKGEISAVIIEEKKLAWKDDKGADVKFAHVWCQILPNLPKDVKLPLPMLRRLAEMNDTCLFGGIGVGKNQDGDQIVYRNLHVYLRAADPGVLNDFVYVAHYDRLNLRKELQGYLEDK